MSAQATVRFEHSGLVHEAPGPDGEGVDYGSFVVRVASQLDDIAREHGVSPLSSFHWADPEMLQAVMEELEGPARDKVERTLAAQREWHDVTEGRRTVAALVGALTGTNPPTLPLREGPQAVLHDLRALAAILAATNERFRLESM